MTLSAAGDCVFILAHQAGRFMIEQVDAIQNGLPAHCDCFLVLEERVSIKFALQFAASSLIVITDSELYTPAYPEKTRARRLIPGNTDLLYLAAWRQKPHYRNYWVIEFDVYAAGGWRSVFDLGTISEADLLASGVWPRPPTSTWMHWSSLTGSKTEPLPDVQWAAFLPLMRLSCAAFAALDSLYSAGWNGHSETAVASACIARRLQIESFDTATERAGRKGIYDRDSFGIKPPRYTSRHNVYHPVKRYADLFNLFATGREPDTTVTASMIEGARCRAIDLTGLSGKAVVANCTFDAPCIVNADSSGALDIQVGGFTSFAGGSAVPVRIGRFCSVAEGSRIASALPPASWLSTSSAHHAQNRQAWRSFAQQAYHDVARPYGKPVGGALSGTVLAGPAAEFDASSAVVIGNDVWIGAGVIINIGLCIGDGAIVGHGAIVTEDVPDYAIVSGAPAKITGYRFDEKVIERLMKLRWWNYNILAIPSIDLSRVNEVVPRIEDMIAADMLGLLECLRYGIVDFSQTSDA